MQDQQIIRAIIWNIAAVVFMLQDLSSGPCVFNPLVLLVIPIGVVSLIFLIGSCVKCFKRKRFRVPLVINFTGLAVLCCIGFFP